MTGTDLTTIEALRPPTEPLDAEWSAGALAAILAGPAPRRRPPRRLAAGLACAAALGGGAAYAVGNNLPAFIQEDVEPAAQQHGDSNLADRMAQIADLPLPDGGRFAAWRAVGDRIVCEAQVDNWDRATQPADSGWAAVSCGADADRESNPIRVVVTAGAPSREDAETWYPVLYGVTDTEASRVRIQGALNWSGRRVDLVLPVDPGTRSFATVLPGRWRQQEYPVAAIEPASGLTISFLGVGGEVLDTADIDQ